MIHDPNQQPPLPNPVVYHQAEPTPRPRRPVITPYAVYTLIALNVLVFALTGLTGGLIDTNIDVLYRFGMLDAPSVWQGQWWRLLSSMFLHGGLLHIAFNMWALRNLGADLERIYGKRAFIALYFGAGWTGSLCSLVFSNPNIGSVGASGAIFGLAGAWLAIALRRKDYFQDFGRQVLFIIVINLWFSYAARSIIDIHGHIGGLTGGFLLGLILPNKLAEFRGTSWRWPVSIAALTVFLLATPLAVRLSQSRNAPIFDRTEN